MSKTICYALTGLCCFAFSVGRAAVQVDFVTVGDEGNPPDYLNNGGATGVGRLLHSYKIGKHVITNAQYAEFLNTVEPNGVDAALQLYNSQMSSDTRCGGIAYSAAAQNGAKYSAKAGFENKPVVYVSFLDAMRFCNWLHNGQPAGGGTETGAYDMSAGGLQAHSSGALYWVPTDNEWYKAAYYDPARGPSLPNYVASRGAGPYWLYATRSDVAPNFAGPNTTDANSANFYNVPGATTEAGSYTQAFSHYGTYDQAGNVWNLIEEVVNGSARGIRGGAWSVEAYGLQSVYSNSVGPGTELDNVGFRIAATAPGGGGGAVTPGAIWRILPLGDSITQSNVGFYSYRYYLWKSLLDEGVNFDLVGSLPDNAGGNPAWPPHLGLAFDHDHEGHSGLEVAEILSALPGWMSGYTPDIVLLHAGTNDALRHRSIPAAVNSIKGIIDALRAKNPNVAVLLAKIIPLADAGANAQVNTLNAAMSGIALEKNTAASRVIVVDMNAAISVADTYDGIHLSSAGEQKMAKKWFGALQPFFLKASVSLAADWHLNLSYLRLQLAPELTYKVEVSNDFTNWTFGPGVTQELSANDNMNGTETVLVRDLESTVTQPRRFIRLRLEYAQ